MTNEEQQLLIEKLEDRICMLEAKFFAQFNPDKAFRDMEYRLKDMESALKVFDKYTLSDLHNIINHEEETKDYAKLTYELQELEERVDTIEFELNDEDEDEEEDEE